MSVEDDQCDDDKVAQRRDAILLRLLTMPPKTHAELAEELRRAKREKPTQSRGKRAIAEKREGAA
jgi:RNA-binding protein YhbY